MTDWPRPGDVVECVRANSAAVGSVSLLRKGSKYTILTREDTAWIKGVRLVEISTTGVAPFSVSRFKPVEKDKK